ncbi:hypothetical protein ALC60_11109 [Trachymyrmex zeteki]|uniref:Uncharacterized protein n=1 Tax=Mycetomoellerius zeteki TaxID=64791 RepID=A0A151WPS9_9HYME|nr:hypothetical protein ALC60_11109 [Trachymyrmex zeteki]
MDHETRNGTGSNDNEEYTNIYFIVGDRRETTTYKANQVTDMELKGIQPCTPVKGTGFVSNDVTSDVTRQYKVIPQHRQVS